VVTCLREHHANSTITDHNRCADIGTALNLHRHKAFSKLRFMFHSRGDFLAHIAAFFVVNAAEAVEPSFQDVRFIRQKLDPRSRDAVGDPDGIPVHVLILGLAIISAPAQSGMARVSKGSGGKIAQAARNRQVQHLEGHIRAQFVHVQALQEACRKNLGHIDEDIVTAIDQKEISQKLALRAQKRGIRDAAGFNVAGHEALQKPFPVRACNSDDGSLRCLDLCHGQLLCPTYRRRGCVNPRGDLWQLTRLFARPRSWRTFLYPEIAMSLAHGRHYLAIPGPSVMPDRVLQAMHRPAPNIYAGELVELTHSLVPDLKAVARTEHQVAMYIANGHGAWEAALANILSRGDRVLVLATGRFGHGWGMVADALGARCETLDFGHQAPIDLARVSAALADDKGHEIKAVLAVQVDTSTSVKNDIRGIRQAMDEVGHPALLCSDNIACLGCDAFEMDAWGVDVMVTGSQKGLMTPPGMAFVYFNDRAERAREAADLVTPYWDWRPRVDPEEYYQFFNGTAPTHHLYGLRAALDMILEEGVEPVWKRHAKLAQAIWTALETWGQGGAVKLNVPDPACRSHAVTTVNFGPGNGQRVRDWMTQEAGVTLGIPLPIPEMVPEDHLRIGHMGHVNAHMVLGVLGGLQTAMSALQIPHDPAGLAAAAEVLGQAA